MIKIIKVFHFLHEFVIYKIHDLKTKISLNQFLYFSAFLIGITIASLVIGLKWVLNFIQHFLFVEQHAESTILWIFLPMLGFLLTTFLVHKIFGKQGYKQGLSNILLAISQKKK